MEVEEACLMSTETCAKSKPMLNRRAGLQGMGKESGMEGDKLESRKKKKMYLLLD